MQYNYQTINIINLTIMKC